MSRANQPPDENLPSASGCLRVGSDAWRNVPSGRHKRKLKKDDATRFTPSRAFILSQEKQELTSEEKQEHAAKKYKKLKKGDLEKVSRGKGRGALSN